MIISHSKKFIFIHIYKVAGTSVNTALREFSFLPTKENRLKSFFCIYPSIYTTDFEGHIKAKELKYRIPEKLFNNYFKFAFVRNPWDWQVSLYHFALQTPEHYQHRLVKNMKSFDEYIDWRINKDLNLQKDFLYEDNILLVDYVGKKEQIENNMTSICKNIKLPNIKIPHKRKSNHRDYKEYYNSSTKIYIEEAFAEDIKTFDYNF